MSAPTILRQAPRILARQNAPLTRTLPARRLLNTAPPHKTSRSWKNNAARWTLALGIVYWYNTNTLFAEEAAYPVSQPLSPTDETTLPTLDSIAQSREKQKKDRASAKQSSIYPSSSDSATLPSSPTSSSQSPQPPPAPSENAATTTTTGTDNPLSSTEEEAHAQGAFNEETGEINWDCPCLGGMAHGPCGPEFREAFSCFVYSKEEPKGMECIDKFKGMQDCFRAHPEEYGDELAREEEEREVEEEVVRRGGKEGTAVEARKALGQEETREENGNLSQEQQEKVSDTPKVGVKKAEAPLAGDEGGELVPNASHDAR